MWILFNQEGYTEILVDDTVWCFDVGEGWEPMFNSKVHPNIPLLCFMDKQDRPYLYWAWSAKEW